MPGSVTPPSRTGACDDAPARVAFDHSHGLGTRNWNKHFVAQWLACTYPCQRFASDLAIRHASLGDNLTR